MKAHRYKDISGNKYSRLLVLSYSHTQGNARYSFWNCKCDCGNFCVVSSHALKIGGTKSCGCLNDEKRRIRRITPLEIKEKRAEYWKKYYSNHRNYLIRKAVEYRGENRDYKKEYLKHKERMRLDLNYRIKVNLRNRILQALRLGTKGGSFVKDLGCSIPDFRGYLSNLFRDGMSWDNYGKWQIDHLKPLSTFDLRDKKQFKEAVHFTNHQPLWAKENQSKGARIIA